MRASLTRRSSGSFIVMMAIVCSPISPFILSANLLSSSVLVSSRRSEISGSACGVCCSGFEVPGTTVSDGSGMSGLFLDSDLVTAFTDSDGELIVIL